MKWKPLLLALALRKYAILLLAILKLVLTNAVVGSSIDECATSEALSLLQTSKSTRRSQVRSPVPLSSVLADLPALPMLEGSKEKEPDAVPNHCGFPQCQYINLASRKDRRGQVEQELGHAGISCERVEAVDAAAEGLTPEEGCRRSHLLALDRIEASGLPYGLVLEDDMMWQERNSTLQEMFCHISKHIDDYPVILLACNGHGRPIQPNLPLQFVEDCQTASAYVVRRDYIKVLRSQWNRDLPTDAIDQTWKPLQLPHSWAMTSPLLVKQRPSWSNIEGKYVDYKVLLQGRSTGKQ